MSNVVSRSGRASYRRPAVSVLSMVGLLLILIVGLAISVNATWDSSPLLLIFGAFLFSVGVVMLVALILEWRHVRNRPGARLGTTPDGLSATVVPRAGWTILVSVATLVVLAVSALAAAGVTLSRGEEVLGVLLLGLGLGMGSYLVPFARGRVSPGGCTCHPKP